MLVFEGQAGDFRQIEGIIIALRALHLERNKVIPALLRMYAIMKGEPYEGKIPPVSMLDRPRDFARTFIFDLPPVTGVPVNDIPELNKRLKEFLIAA